MTIARVLTATPNAKVWFQELEDTLPNGTTVVREYLMTTGYLWTGQYEECKSVIEDGKGQSMEFDEKSFKGQWTKNYNNNMEFFIINDATFSKLCILGDDVEPCFEGANITSQEISKTFTKNEDNFVQTLYTMMQDLKQALEKGGKNMENENKTPIIENGEAQPAIEFNNISTENSTAAVNTDGSESQTGAIAATSYVEKNEKDEKNNDSKDKENNDEKNEQPEKKDDDKKEQEEEDSKKKYSLLEQKFNELETKYSCLEKDYQNLVEFKNKVDEKAKLDKINEFSMLTDEDKKDVMDNLQKYTLEEIESKLSVTCFHKKVNFNLEDNEKNNNNIDEQKLVAYSLAQENSSLPDWVKAVKNNE